ncbi:hypothetical protein [Janibacter sp. GS2]|uniref:hypothetical protein n=1 Tax=Janibacter sp. GS2 TaxID=3442646 RepID=UPI003EB92E52
MSTLILRVTGAVLALIGLGAVVVGGWFLAALGPSGTATFTAEPEQRVVVLDPDVLNRVDAPVEVTATGGGTVWAGIARPSDAEALLGEGARADVTGVTVGDWDLTTRTVGSGESVDAGSLDIWRSSTSGKGTTTTTIDQDQAPQTLVITAPQGEDVEQVELVVSDDRWATTAIALLVGGVLALVVGAALVLRTGVLGAVRRRRTQEAGA